MSSHTVKLESAIKEIQSEKLPTAQEIENGPKIDPIKFITTYGADEWETFIEEWVYSLESMYVAVMRPTGSGDKGIDIAGFCDENELLGVWDNYQCKHYAKPINFSVVAPEIGKILWFAFNGVYTYPRSCRFIAPLGPSTTLNMLLANAEKLREKVIDDWDKSIANKITSTTTVSLKGDFEEFVSKAEFSIFSAPAPRAIIEAHRSTRFYLDRFGGSFPSRPMPEPPPDEILEDEANYTTKLLDAYAEHKGEEITCASQLSSWPNLKAHFQRSRECFYHAESLRVFVRDKAAPGTFESLQTTILRSVGDVYDRSHEDGYQRVLAVTDKADSLKLDAHPLNKSAYPEDRRGVCHQLANDGRLTWKQ